jgi:hypothetical protein
VGATDGQDDELMDWSSIVAGALAGLAAGVVGSLIAPWVQLAVENRRETRTHRRRSIEIWRAMVGRHMNSGTRVIQTSTTCHCGVTFGPRSSSNWNRARTRSPSANGTEGISANSEISAVTEEIDRLEREWKLA